MQTYNWTMYALRQSSLSGGIRAEAMARRRSFFKHYTHSNIQLNKTYALLWKYSEWWASSRSNGFQKNFSKNIIRRNKHYTHGNIHLRSVEVHFKHKQWLEEIFQNMYASVNIHWKYTECWASSRSNVFQKKFFKTLYTFKHTLEQNMPLCESTLSGGLQAEAMGFRRSFSKHYTHSTIQLNKVCFAEEHFSNRESTKYRSGGLQTEAMASRRIFSKHFTFSNTQLNKKCTLWKYTEWWASSRSNGFQKKFFKTLYTFNYTIEQSMRSAKVQWVHFQTHNWLQAEAMGFRGSLSNHYTHSNIHLNKVCLMWKYTEWWASSRSNGFQKKFFKTLYTFKHTIEQSMRSAKVQWVVGFQQKQWVSEEVFQKLYTFKHTLEQSKPSVKVHWVVGFKQKQWLAEELFPNIIHMQNIQLNKVCALRKYTEWLDSGRSNGFQKKFFKTFYIFKHTIEQNMNSVKVHWVVGLKQKQWVSEEVFQNIIHNQTYNWTKYALREITVSGGLQAEAMGFRRSFSKHYTPSNIHLNKVCLLWKYTEWWASSRSNGFQKKFFKTLYTFKHTIEQTMLSAKVQWVVGFKQKQWV